MMMDGHTRWRSPWIRALWCLLSCLPLSGFAQDRLQPGYVLLERLEDGYVERTWPQGIPKPDESTAWQERLLGWYHEQAHFIAKLDSIGQGSKAVWVRPGPLVPIASVTVETDEGMEPHRLQDDVGEPATKERIESVMTRLLTEASQSGYLAAEAGIVRAEVGGEGLHLLINMNRGKATRLERVILEGDDRTHAATVETVTGMRSGQLLAGGDLEAARALVAAAGWHERVMAGRFELVSDSTAILVLPVEPMPPGRFDFVAGALPGVEGGTSRFMGSGHLALNNAFGRGRMIEAAIRRLPGQASSAHVFLESPAPGGWPLRGHVELQGHQQDSTWNQTRIGTGLRYQFDAATWIGASFSADGTRAGFSGSDLIGQRQRVPRSSSRMGGLTMLISRLDDTRYPRQGFRLETALERGIRSSRGREIVAGDTLFVDRSERRERLEMDLDLYLMSHRHVGWALGVDIQAIRAGRPDVSELIFLGGATSLRGYDENRFQGTTVGRAFLEGRWYVDRRSWGFLFFDAGWVVVDADFESGLPLILSRGEGFHPGYGFGFVFSSAVGPLSLSYALNPEITWSEGRVHIGLSFGL